MTDQVKELLEGLKSQVDERLKGAVQMNDIADFVKSADLGQVSEQLTKLQAQFDSLPLGQVEGEKSEPATIHELFTKSFKQTGKHEADLFIKAIRQSQNVTGAPTAVQALAGAAFAPNPLRELASVIETTATALDVPVRTGSHGAAKAAANRGTTAKATGDAAVGNAKVLIGTFEALNEVSIESADDIPAFDEFWTADIVNELASVEAADHAGVVDSLTAETSAAAGTMTLDDLAGLLWSVNPAYRANGSWMVSSNAMQIIRTMNASGTGSDLIFDAQLGAFRLFGHPVYENAYMDAVAGGNRPVAFGDFKRGVIVASRAAAKVGRYEQTKPGYYTFYGVLRSGISQYIPGAVKALEIDE